MNSRQQFLLFGITPDVLTPVQISQVNRLFDLGLDYLYIRSKVTDVVAWHHLLDKIDPLFYGRLLLPGNAPLQATHGKHIRHVREKERFHHAPEGAASSGLLSTSVHAFSAVPELAAYAFVFYSPLFPSISKPGYQPQTDLNSLAKQLAGWRRQRVILPHLIGLGGVDAGNIAQVKAAGFQGAGLLGALWQGPSPLEAFTQIKMAASTPCP